MRKLPPSSVVVVRVAPVSRLFTVTVAPLTSAPVASFTLPEIAAATWVHAGTAPMASRTRTISLTDRRRLGQQSRSCILTQPPPLRKSEYIYCAIVAAKMGGNCSRGAISRAQALGHGVQ